MTNLPRPISYSLIQIYKFDFDLIMIFKNPKTLNYPQLMLTAVVSLERGDQTTKFVLKL